MTLIRENVSDSEEAGATGIESTKVTRMVSATGIDNSAGGTGHEELVEVGAWGWKQLPATNQQHAKPARAILEV